MGAELLKLTRYMGFEEGENHLKDFRCSNCDLLIDDKDIEQNNYQLWVSDYANDINKNEFFADRVGRNLTSYSLTFWLKGVDHKECPKAETCEICYERKLTATMKEFEGDYYCLSCWPVEKEVKHE